MSSMPSTGASEGQRSRRTTTVVQQQFASAIANHMLWSTLAVSGRYLQVYASPVVFHGMAVLAVSKALSGVLLFANGCWIHSRCSNTCRHPPHRGRDATREAAATTTTTEASVSDGPNDSSNHSGSGSRHRRPSGGGGGAKLRTKVFYAVLFGSVATFRACFNMASTKFTLSYNISTYLISPLFL
jgi:hypothetical protein